MRYEARFGQLSWKGEVNYDDCQVIKKKGFVTVDFNNDEIYRLNSVKGTHYFGRDASGNTLELHKFRGNKIKTYVGQLRLKETGEEYLIRLILGDRVKKRNG